MPARLKTRFTEFFDIDCPVMLAPMDKVAGGALAAAVTRAGGLGLLGGGYGDADWIEQAHRDAGNERVGIGFITWSVLRTPELVDQALSHKPAALMVSFGDAEDIIAKAKAQDTPTIWQVHTVAQAEQAAKAGVDVIVVQGQEAGGHGMDRGLMALLPAARDATGPDQIILAAGGIADGRGLAGALMLGGDGIMMGTRFCASAEADDTDIAKAGLVKATGDGTVRSKVFDVARAVDWPWHFTGRVVRNAFADKWVGNIEDMKMRAAEAQEAYNASQPDDHSIRALIAGEAVDFISRIEPAGDIVARIVEEASDLLKRAPRYAE
ncbi:MAG: nitronate monooxygenase [Hyphomicrobiaceae bacterium]|nr:nitronate monooxygenase [Hyphomicrobiaceae bacterium]